MSPTGFGDEQLPPARLAAEIKGRLAASDNELSGFWYQVRENRTAYAREVQEHLTGYPVVVLVVRKTRFDNTNAVLDDFVELLQDSKEACEKHLIGDVTTDRRAVVLLARNTLDFPQISSPVTLPAWFPRLGSRLANVIIEDLTWRAACPLNAEEAAIDQLCQLIFALEGAMLERLRPVHAQDKSAAASFWDQVKRDKDAYGSFGDFLEGVQQARRNVLNSSSYRPSVRDGSSLLARIWGKTQATSPDAMGRLAKALARALALPDSLSPSGHRSLVAILFRPPNASIPDPQSLFASSLLTTILATCQLITAAAHADAYPRYPVPLIRSTSFDLRQTLADARQTLIILDPCTG
ncbi:hypothetical protein [Streptomyces sp. NPDC094144]|uniref:hypothetical protein n=1 Tax=Streptomyces sp. NPDC094144 TaxID=3366056 RepID=UPI0038302AEE